jgi:hypothetical protein
MYRERVPVAAPEDEPARPAEDWILKDGTRIMLDGDDCFIAPPEDPEGVTYTSKSLAAVLRQGIGAPSPRVAMAVFRAIADGRLVLAPEVES